MVGSEPQSRQADGRTCRTEPVWSFRERNARRGDIFRASPSPLRSGSCTSKTETKHHNSQQCWNTKEKQQEQRRHRTINLHIVISQPQKHKQKICQVLPMEVVAAATATKKRKAVCWSTWVISVCHLCSSERCHAKSFRRGSTSVCRFSTQTFVGCQSFLSQSPTSTHLLAEKNILVDRTLLASSLWPNRLDKRWQSFWHMLSPFFWPRRCEVHVLPTEGRTLTSS